MGLDIHLNTPEQFGYEELYFDVHSLSRTFCRLMTQRYTVAAGTAALDRLGQLTGVPVAPLYQMTEYAPLDRLAEFRYLPADATERQQVIRQAEADNAALAGNLELVAGTINALLERLPALPDLPQRLAAAAQEPADDYEPYFGALDQDPGDGYIGNNLGQDLRNFRRFLDYARSRGSHTVFFEFG